jgi:hypothetical protein
MINDQDNGKNDLLIDFGIDAAGHINRTIRKFFANDDWITLVELTT